MNSGEKSLRLLVGKWFGLAAAVPVHVMEFSRTPSDRRRFVRVGVARPQGRLTIVFFRHDDGSWNVFPPMANTPAMRPYRFAA
ncbi:MULTISPECIES: hypothetical protein [Caballeronia]|uniref:hypothetical protein n=1 Tax=Caballeronia TaxID=1827195 RepID=UPI00025BC831|nr:MULTISPECIES: hypothetical protein [Caballeronia]EKS71808.1 hypothetical protein BURK_008216 [Burkholderia sp. SJ98]